MNNNKTIIHLSYEVAPFYKNGGLGDVVYALPKYLSKKYKNIVISIYYKGLMKYMDEFTFEVFEIDIHGIPYRIFCYSKSIDDVEYVFLNLEDEFVFSNNGFKENDGNNPYRNLSSPIIFLFFAKAALILIKNKFSNVKHLICHDWHPGFIFAYPSLLKQINKYLKTFVIIHNYSHQCELFDDIYPFLEKEPLIILKGLSHEYGKSTLLGLAIDKSDYVLTVSKNYAFELKEKLVPHEDFRFIEKMKKPIIGLLNGADYSIWHPYNSPYLKYKFNLDSINLKYENKLNVFKKCGFNIKESHQKPLMLYMCRLTEQKGISLFYDSFDEKQEQAIKYLNKIIRLGVKIVVLGTPSEGMNGPIHNALITIQNNFKDSFYYDYNYDELKAHEMLAGSDIVLIPSMFEPCGLVQIYSIAFGTIPIVRPTGGLKDTISCYFENKHNPTGFYIPQFSREALYQTIKKVIDIYKYENSTWQTIQNNCMKQNYSWESLIKNYLKLFKKAEIE